MLPIRDVKQTVAELLEAQFPGEKVYRDNAPNKFTRPSFLVTSGRVQLADASARCLEVALGINLILFVEADPYHNSHVDELERRLMLVLELFTVEGLRVSDRVLGLYSTVGDVNFDYAEVNLSFRYLDDRPGGESWPMIKEIHTTIKEG